MLANGITWLLLKFKLEKYVDYILQAKMSKVRIFLEYNKINFYSVLFVDI